MKYLVVFENSTRKIFTCTEKAVVIDGLLTFNDYDHYVCKEVAKVNFDKVLYYEVME